MNDPWYESQLVGVVVGAVLGFVSSFLPRYFEERQKRSLLRDALKAEIGAIVEHWRTRIPVYSDYITTLRKRGPCAIYYASERDPDVVFQSNAGNLGLLPPNVVNDLVLFYVKVGDLHSRIRALQDVFQNYNTRTDPTLDTDFLVGAIERALEMMKSIIEQGNAVLSDLRRDGRAKSGAPVNFNVST